MSERGMAGRGSGAQPVDGADHSLLAGSLVVVVVLAAMLAQRFYITADSGGRGVASLFVPVLLAVGLACLGMDRQSVHRADWSRLFTLWGPYWACVSLLPLLAVTLGSYEPRVAFSAVTDGLVPIAVVAIGIRASTLSRDPTRLLAVALGLAVPVVLIYSLGQWAYASGALDATIWRPFADWDLAAAQAFGVAQVSRSSGPFINPNILGAWGAITFVLCASLGRFNLTKPPLMGAAALTVLFSQSRGAFVALIVGVIVLVLVGSPGEGRKGSRAALALSLLGAGAVAAIGLGLAGNQMPGVARIADGLLSLVPGSALDPSLAGRLDFWSAAGVLSSLYPLGTFGPPETLLGSAVDNDWIRLFLQASVVGVAALALMLFGGALTAGRSGSTGRALAASSVTIAVLALTQTPLAYPPMLLYWIVVGFAVVRPAVVVESAHEVAVAVAPRRAIGGRPRERAREAS